jgi:hypothetical protein|tara:strand:- start:59 stop:739 length:681 start_codon:yes stop_codon:yes gene_type:complete
MATYGDMDPNAMPDMYNKEVPNAESNEVPLDRAGNKINPLGRSVDNALRNLFGGEGVGGDPTPILGILPQAPPNPVMTNMGKTMGSPVDIFPRGQDDGSDDDSIDAMINRIVPEFPANPMQDELIAQDNIALETSLDAGGEDYMEDNVSVRPNITKTDDNRPMTIFERLGNVPLRNKVEDSQTGDTDPMRNQSLFDALIDYFNPSRQPNTNIGKAVAASRDPSKIR